MRQQSNAVRLTELLAASKKAWEKLQTAIELGDQAVIESAKQAIESLQARALGSRDQ